MRALRFDDRSRHRDASDASLKKVFEWIRSGHVAGVVMFPAAGGGAGHGRKVQPRRIPRAPFDPGLCFRSWGSVADPAPLTSWSAPRPAPCGPIPPFRQRWAEQVQPLRPSIPGDSVIAAEAQPASAGRFVVLRSCMKSAGRTHKASRNASSSLLRPPGACNRALTPQLVYDPKFGKLSSVLLPVAGTARAARPLAQREKQASARQASAAECLDRGAGGLLGPALRRSNDRSPVRASCNTLR